MKSLAMMVWEENRLLDQLCEQCNNKDAIKPLMIALQKKQKEIKRENNRLLKEVK